MDAKGDYSIALEVRNGALTTDEAIEYMKISRHTYLKYVCEARIRAIKAGNDWRVLQSELIRFLKGGARK